MAPLALAAATLLACGPHRVAPEGPGPERGLRYSYDVSDGDAGRRFAISVVPTKPGRIELRFSGEISCTVEAHAEQTASTLLRAYRGTGCVRPPPPAPLFEAISALERIRRAGRSRWSGPPWESGSAIALRAPVRVPTSHTAWRPEWTRGAVIAGPCEEAGRHGVLVQLPPEDPPRQTQVREICADPASPFPLRATGEAGGATLIAVEPAPTAPAATAAELAGTWLPADAGRKLEDRGSFRELGWLIRADGTLSWVEVRAERRPGSGERVFRAEATGPTSRFRVTPDSLRSGQLELTIQRTGETTRLLLLGHFDGSRPRGRIDVYERFPVPPAEVSDHRPPPPSAQAAYQEALRDGRLEEARGIATHGGVSLDWLATFGDVESVEEFLRQAPARLRTPEELANALESSVGRGRVDVVAALLAKGADPNPTSPTMPSKLCAAVRSGSVATVRLLLAAGADPRARWQEHVKDDSGHHTRTVDKTAFDCAASGEWDDVEEAFAGSRSR